MIFPPAIIYTNTVNQFRAPYDDLNNPQNSIAYETYLGDNFHKNRFFGHFVDQDIFADAMGNATLRAKYPIHWQITDRTLGNKLGISHHLAEVGPSTGFTDNVTTHKLFQLQGRSDSDLSGSQAIIDVRSKNSAGNYISKPYTNTLNRTAFRSPFHPKYNIQYQHHDYPRAKYSNESDFTATVNGDTANPLSKAATQGGFVGFKFSAFRHYGSASTRSNNSVNLTIPLNPRTNPNPLCKGWGHDFVVTNTKPIERTNWFSALAQVQTWSPYSASLKLDFLNGKRYNGTLQSSSVWSK